MEDRIYMEAALELAKEAALDGEVPVGCVIVRKGEIVGDVSMLELQEQGKDLMSYVKEVYSYRADRVSRALHTLTGEDE